MEPVSLVVDVHPSGVAKAVFEGAAGAVSVADGSLKRLVDGGFAGKTSAELGLLEHADDPRT
jgi:hypothetical protein